MKIAVVEFNPNVGALEQNGAEIIRLYEEIATNSPEVDIVVFPEMAITGYPIEDLALNPTFIFDTHKVNTTVTHHVLDRASGPALIVGTIQMRQADKWHSLHGPVAENVALIAEPDETVQVVVKHEMANYGVFDEKRTFSPGRVLSGYGVDKSSNTVMIKGAQVGIAICEDGWHEAVPEAIRDDTPDFVIWINASPFEFEKRAARRDVMMRNFGKLNRPVIYANMCGGQDELVFDGDSFMLTREDPDDWRPICTAGDRFMPNQIVMFDTEVAYYPPASVPDTIPAIYRAIVLGVRDYITKQGFTRAVIGMSGGVDSALVAAIACDAIGPKNVDLIGLPSAISSPGSVIDAGLAAKAQGARFTLIGIGGVVGATNAAYGQLGDADRPNQLTGLAAENIQARIRGLLLMALSNQEGAILLTTGNKSEVSVGYSTLYGDMAGGYNPIKDCYKTTVWDMCTWRNTLGASQLAFLGFLGRDTVIPERIIEKPPSAELSLDQRDDQSLPPYPVLDAILKLMIEKHQSNQEIIRAGNDPETVERVRMLVDRAEYKRRQAAPGVKITSKLHGRDRRVPINNHWHG